LHPFDKDVVTYVYVYFHMNCLLHPDCIHSLNKDPFYVGGKNSIAYSNSRDKYNYTYRLDASIISVTLSDTSQGYVDS